MIGSMTGRVFALSFCVELVLYQVVWNKTCTSGTAFNSGAIVSPGCVSLSVPATLYNHYQLWYYIYIIKEYLMTKVIKHNFLKSSNLCKTSWTFPVVPSDDPRKLSQGVAQVTQQDYVDQLREERRRQLLLKLLREE